MTTHLLPTSRLEAPTVRALRRDRVDQLIDRAWHVPVTVVVGPAGAGKTTAVGHLARRSTGPVLWYRASAVDGEEHELVRHLAMAMAHAHRERPTWVDLGEAWNWLAQWAPAPGALVVIDEFDSIVETVAERVLTDVINDSAETVHLVAMSRRRPSLNLTRLRLAGLANEVGPDDLRFRSWEVDRLFRDLYHRPLPPDQVAELERRTGGWVAALQLFDLATAHLSPAAREATISRVGRRAGPDWDYLADNVVAGLGTDHRSFLVETSPLERLDADLCDELLDITYSSRCLGELERAQLITAADDDPSSYRCHEVLRSHLEAILVDSVGEESVRKRCSHAAGLLEGRGRYVEALRAYLRADDRAGADQILRARGVDMADRPGRWVDRLPSRLVHDDPWLLLARARQYRNDGRLDEAVVTYERLETVAFSTALVTTARAERFVTAALADHRLRAPAPWISLLRAAGRGELRAVTDQAGDDPTELLISGVACLIAGTPALATSALRAVLDRPDTSAPVAVAARLALSVATGMSGAEVFDDLDGLDRLSMALDLPFFARLHAAVTCAMCGSHASVADVVEECVGTGDEFGAAICEALDAVGRLTRGPASLHDEGPPAAESVPRSSERCRRLGLDGLAWWIELATHLDVRDGAMVRTVEFEARRRGATPIATLARAMARSTGGSGEDAAAVASRLRDDYGLHVAPPLRTIGGPRVVPADRADSPLVSVQCFGGLRVAVDDIEVDLTDLRPRARSVLSMLAVHAGSAVHREVICLNLWPDDDLDDATRKLHVAVSSIRRVVRERTGQQLIERRGESYQLAAPGLSVDVAEYWRDVDLADAQAAAGLDFGPAAERALRRRRDVLLPEYGPSDWLLEPQRRVDMVAVRLALARAASILAEDPVGAAEWCRIGLGVERWNVPLWQLLQKALAASGDEVGLALTRRDYDEVLGDLEVR